MSTADQARFAKQKELFLEAMAEFEASNRTLRRLLRDQHRIEASSLRLSEQRDVLMRKLADADMVNEVSLLICLSTTNAVKAVTQIITKSFH